MTSLLPEGGQHLHPWCGNWLNSPTMQIMQQMFDANCKFLFLFKEGLSSHLDVKEVSFLSFFLTCCRRWFTTKMPAEKMINSKMHFLQKAFFSHVDIRPVQAHKSCMDGFHSLRFAYIRTQPNVTFRTTREWKCSHSLSPWFLTAFWVLGSQWFRKSINETLCRLIFCIQWGSRSHWRFPLVAFVFTVTTDTSEPLDKSIQTELDSKMPLLRIKLSCKSAWLRRFILCFPQPDSQQWHPHTPQMALNC